MNVTNFNKIKNYYSLFDEWNRLENPEGRLEFEIVIDTIRQYLPAHATVFDLGSGPGRYAVAISNQGHKLYLADLSPALINIAQDKIRQLGTPGNVIQTDVCNALDLSGGPIRICQRHV